MTITPDGNGSTPAPAATATPAPSPAPAATATPSPTPGTSPTHATTPATTTPAPTATPATPAPEVKPGEEPPAAYKVPDAYKEKPWASKIKSDDDLWKQVDNLQTAVGKKGMIIPDFKTATPEQIEEFVSATRPADKGVYKFGEGVDEGFVGEVGDIFLKNGISEYQGNKVIEAYQALEDKRVTEATSADGFKAVMAKSFGDKFEGDVKAVTTEIGTRLSPEDKQMLEGIPNQYLGMIYRLTRSMQKAYGANENGSAHTGDNGSPGTQDLTAVRAGIRTEIAALSTRMHTAEEKQTLINKLQATYNTQQRK